VETNEQLDLRGGVLGEPHPKLGGCLKEGGHDDIVGSARPNVRGNRATAAGRQARAGENVPRTTSPG
jgi:hypothetical protein